MTEADILFWSSMISLVLALVCLVWWVDSLGKGGKEMNAEELCEKAGVNPNEKITKFVMVDLADVLVGAGWEEGRIIKALEKTRPNKLADALCEASGWPEIFECYADCVLEED